MAIDIGSIFEKIHALEAELDAELARRAAELRFGFEHGKLVFEQEVLRRHRELKVSLWAYIKRANILIVLTAPVIYSLIIPLAILDLFLFIFQAVCFPTYGITRVKRSDYVVFDLLCQWADRLCARNCFADGSVLVPDQTRQAITRRTLSL